MPNTPERGKEQPRSDEQRKRQQSNDKLLQGTDDADAEDEEIEAPGTEEDETSEPLRTQGGETGEDEDLPDDASTQRNPSPSNVANDRQKGNEAGRSDRRQ
jgi:hypothetical protein